VSVTPIAVGDTVALTGHGWAGMVHPNQMDFLLGQEVTVAEVAAGFGAPSVIFEIDGHPFIAPTRPGSTFQAEPLPTTV